MQGGGSTKVVQGHHVGVSPISERMGSRRKQRAAEFPWYEICRCWEETKDVPRRRRVPMGRDGCVAALGAEHPWCATSPQAAG